MATLTLITILTEPIGSIPRLLDLIKRLGKGDRRDPNFALFYENAIREIENWIVGFSSESLLQSTPYCHPEKSVRRFVRTWQELALVQGRRLVLN